MTRAHRRHDAGFTLIELVITVVIMGVITLPLGNFALAYFKNYTQTQARLSDSHDVQIATAYFSQDIADTGLRGAASPYTPAQSVWTTGFPSGYCGTGLSGTPLVLVKWDDFTASGGSGVDTIDSAAYIVKSGTLHRVFCSGSSQQSDATVVHNLVYPDSGNATPVTCSTACAGATPPVTVSLRLSIEASGDSSISYVTLSGQRRQSSS